MYKSVLQDAMYYLDNMILEYVIDVIFAVLSLKVYSCIVSLSSKNTSAYRLYAII